MTAATTAKKKKPSQKERILALLADRCWHTTAELNEICFRYGGRFHELRKEGYVFDEQRIGNGPLWRWKLLQTPEQVTLEPHLERTNEQIAERAERLSEGEPLPVKASSCSGVAQDGSESSKGAAAHRETRPVSPNQEYLERMERLDRMQAEEKASPKPLQMGLSL